MRPIKEIVNDLRSFLGRKITTLEESEKLEAALLEVREVLGDLSEEQVSAVRQLLLLLSPRLEEARQITEANSEDFSSV